MLKLAGFILCGSVIASGVKLANELKVSRESIWGVFDKTFELNSVTSFEAKCRIFWLRNYLDFINEGIEGGANSELVLKLLQISPIRGFEALSDFIDEYFMEERRIEQRGIHIVRALNSNLPVSTIKYLLIGGFLDDQRGTIPELMGLLSLRNVHPVNQSAADGFLGMDELMWSKLLEYYMGIPSVFPGLSDRAIRSASDIEIFFDAFQLAGPGFMETLHSHVIKNGECRRKILSTGICLKGTSLKIENLALDEGFCQTIKKIQNLNKELLMFLFVLKMTPSPTSYLECEWKNTLKTSIETWRHLMLDCFPVSNSDAYQAVSELLHQNKKKIAKIARFTVEDLIDCFVWSQNNLLFYNRNSENTLARQRLTQRIGCAEYKSDFEFTTCYTGWILRNMSKDQKWAALKRYLNLPENSTESETIKGFLGKFYSHPITVHILNFLVRFKYLDFEVDWMLKNIIIYFWKLEGSELDYYSVKNEIKKVLHSSDQIPTIVKVISEIKSQILTTDILVASPITIDNGRYFYSLEALIIHIVRKVIEGTSITSEKIEEWIIEADKTDRHRSTQAPQIKAI